MRTNARRSSCVAFVRKEALVRPLLSICLAVAPLLLASAQEARPDPAPAVGAPAPDFVLRRLGQDGSPGDERVRLSAHFGQRPVALVFGSYT
ncbi:MAG: hypothetical protein D6731_01710 [Planctomycetota bacterium]|nr:MAG: hypothetical protein D6731_01710 [Planctomycetota bacterium]